MMQTALLSTTYFGPIQWYQKLYRYDQVLIEQHESFVKQTYRNRCLIATTQGVQALTVPVGHDLMNNEQCTMNNGQWTMDNVKISDHGNWRRLHWQALQSAYGDSPFFEYYADELRPFFEPRWEYLLDFNEAIREKICEFIDIQPHVAYTTEFLSPTDMSLQTSHITDFRTSINPKHPGEDADFLPHRYYQVYEQKHGFLPNLSILDLLFNMGPESIFYL